MPTQLRVSIRASLQQRGEQALAMLSLNFMRVSIRASLQQRGEQLATSLKISAVDVSIRASLQQRGEHPRDLWGDPEWWFQSAPHFSSEANVLTPKVRGPETFVSIRASLQQRGELFSWSYISANSWVSIRASLQQRGERRRCSIQSRKTRFNPRLTSAARRTRMPSRNGRRI